MQTCYSKNILFEYIHYALIGLLIFPVWSCQGQEVADTHATSQASEKPFGDLVNELSGRGGYFDTDNLISNESSYLHVIPQLKELDISGGAYLGVGPDQNFSYIAHIKPEIAFIIDIRRDNMLMHLFYKALFELSDDRLQFLSLLFARDTDPTPSPVKSLTVAALMDVVEQAPPMEETEKLKKTIDEKLRLFDVGLSEKDVATIHRFHEEFISRGPALRFTSHNRSPRAYYPTYKQLMNETDRDGNYASFLSQEIHYQFLKELHEQDRIVPLVGNFADPDAIPAVANYLNEIKIDVSAFYTSNVEYYLMYQGQFPGFIENLQQLPLKNESVIIRSYFNRFRSSHPLTVTGYASTQLLQSMQTMTSHPEATYSDLIFEYFLP